MRVTIDAIGNLKKAWDSERTRRMELELASEVERRAKVYAPKDHGVLAGSPEAFQDQDGAGVRTNVEYAAFQEFGTGVRGAGTDPGPTPPWYQHGNVAGVPAQPYLRPALYDVVGKAGPVLKRTT